MGVVLALVGAFGFRLGKRLVGVFGNCDAVGQAQCRLEAVGQTLRHILAHDDAIDDDVDVVLELLVELRRIRDFIERAVDLDALEALLLELGQLLFVFAFAAAHDGREQVEARAFSQR